MLNYIAAQVVFFALRSTTSCAARAARRRSRRPDADSSTSRRSSTCPAIRLDYGFVVALLMAVAVSWLLFRTTKGFELRAVGLQPDGRALRGHERRRLDDARDGPVGRPRRAGRRRSWSSARSASSRSTCRGGIGFNAIALALLAGLRPSGVVLAALLFGALTNGRQARWASSRGSRSTCSSSSWRWSSCSSPRPA